jgi:prohibitin 1
MSAIQRKLLLLLPVLILITGLVGCGTQVPSGHRGVFYSKFGEGTEMGRILTEGFNWHMPWNNIFVYKVQLEERKEDLTLLSSDGATIGLEVTVWYRPDATRVDSLQITVGPNYYNIAVAPALRGVGRSVVGQYKPEEIYSTKREAIAEGILLKLQDIMKSKFISVENVIIRNVRIPARISDAINAKLAADQEQQKMEFILLKETSEAERKRIEAKGIADFQKIVSTGLTPMLLKWKGIEATEKLAGSSNAKVVVIGSAKDGLPIILGNQ